MVQDFVHPHDSHLSASQSAAAAAAAAWVREASEWSHLGWSRTVGDPAKWPEFPCFLFIHPFFGVKRRQTHCKVSGGLAAQVKLEKAECRKPCCPAVYSWEASRSPSPTRTAARVRALFFGMSLFSPRADLFLDLDGWLVATFPVSPASLWPCCLLSLIEWQLGVARSGLGWLRFGLIRRSKRLTSRLLLGGFVGDSGWVWGWLGDDICVWWAAGLAVPLGLLSVVVK